MPGSVQNAAHLVFTIHLRDECDLNSFTDEATEAPEA